jgi:hypothetical protein
MRHFTRTHLLPIAAFLALGVTAQAQPLNERLTLKFSTPVMVPGTTLPAGTYVFTESKTGQDVIVIYNEDQTRVLATTLAVPAIRKEATGDTVVTIQRTSPEMAPALAKVFYPGKTRGHEFVYSEERAREIADETKQIVLSHDAPEGSDLDALGRARLWKMEPGGKRTEYRRESTAQMASASGGAGEHLNRIEELLDRMLQARTAAVGTTGQTEKGQVLVDRAHLEQLRTELRQLREAIEKQR